MFESPRVGEGVISIRDEQVLSWAAARLQINRAFLTLAMQAGLDCAILDPLDHELPAANLTTELCWQAIDTA